MGRNFKHVCTDMNVGFLGDIGRPEERLLEPDHQRVIVHCDLLVGAHRNGDTLCTVLPVVFQLPLLHGDLWLLSIDGKRQDDFDIVTLR